MTWAGEVFYTAHEGGLAQARDAGGDTRRTTLPVVDPVLVTSAFERPLVLGDRLPAQLSDLGQRFDSSDT